MKYALQNFRVDKKDFLSGNNAYDNYPTGGYLNATVGANVFSKPGLLAQAPALLSAVNTANPGTGFVGFARGYNGSGQGTLLGMYVNSATNYAYWTMITNSTGTHGTAQSDTGGRAYNYYQSDLVYYQSNFYASGASTIAKINADNSTITATWLTSLTDTRTSAAAALLTSNVPHPMLVFEGILYIADGRYLNKLDGTTYTSQVFDVAEGYNITAIVEYRGMIYVFASPITFADGVDLPSHGTSKLYSWDGLQDSWFEEYDIDYPVFSAFVWKNRMYAFTKYFLGVWNGSEITSLYPTTGQVYKHQITTTADSFMFADGVKIVRYGVPHALGGKRKFYNYLDNGATSFAGIASAYNNALILSERAASSKTYYISNPDTPATSGSRTLDFNPRFLKKPVKVRQIVIETEALSSGQKIKCGYTDDAGDVVYPTNSSGEFSNTTSGMAGKKRWKFEVNAAKATRVIIPRFVLTAGVHVRSVDYYYEASEISPNP